VAQKIDICKISYQLFGSMYLKIVVHCFFWSINRKRLKTIMSDESVVNMVSKCAIIAHIVKNVFHETKFCIKNQNNNKLHQRFVKLQENTCLFKHFCIGNWLVIFMKFMFNSFKNLISNILIHFQNKVGENGHYMVCKTCEALVPTYFEGIMMLWLSQNMFKSNKFSN
jgi:hypothetical protein